MVTRGTAEHQNRPAHDVERAFVAFRIGDERGVHAEACAVDQGIDRARRVLQPSRDRGQLRTVAEVGADGLDLYARCGMQPGSDGLQPLWIASDEHEINTCLLYTSPSPRDGLLSRM